MYIYKLTNIINNKIYIGQTTKTIENRFKLHKQSISKKNNNSCLVADIRKYGINAFKIEVIEEVKTKKELNEKEIYWIAFYNSTNKDIGYNMTDGATYADTYKYKNSEEMEIIKNKIRESKQYDKNPNAKSIKCKNIYTNKEYYFSSLKECQEFFNETNHNFITRRCLKETLYLYKDKWIFAYIEDNYPEYTKEKNIKRKKAVIVKDLLTGKEGKFSSFANAERFFKIPLKTLSGKAYRHSNKQIFKIKHFQITLL